MKNIITHTINRSTEKHVLAVFSASILLAISAKIAIPLGPVPFTLQTTTVTFLTLFLGKRLGLASVLLYLVEGAIGLPVFANATGTSFGYLLGFLGSVCLTDYIYRNWNCKTITSLFLLGLISTVPTFVVGLAGLAFIIGIKQAFLVGVCPFIFSEIIKNFGLALFLHKFLKRSK